MVRTCCQVLRTRWKEIRAIHKKYKVFYWLLGSATVVLAALWVGTLLFHGREDRGYEMNIFTEMLGVAVSILVTVLVINVAYERRDKERLRGRLKREAGSRANAIAIAAVEWIRAEGWLEGEDGLLKGEDLSNANLEGANLSGANLNGTILVRANLKGCDLTKALMVSSRMYGAQLTNAKLQGANLTGSDLRCADLRHAKMKGRHLSEEQAKGTDLVAPGPGQTNLSGADLWGALLEGAKLPDIRNWISVDPWPDGEHYSYAADVEKFTHPSDENFKDTLKSLIDMCNAAEHFAVSEVYAEPD